MNSRKRSLPSSTENSQDKSITSTDISSQEWGSQNLSTRSSNNGKAWLSKKRKISSNPTLVKNKFQMTSRNHLKKNHHLTQANPRRRNSKQRAAEKVSITQSPHHPREEPPPQPRRLPFKFTLDRLLQRSKRSSLSHRTLPEMVSKRTSKSVSLAQSRLAKRSAVREKESARKVKLQKHNIWSFSNFIMTSCPANIQDGLQVKLRQSLNFYGRKNSSVTKLQARLHLEPLGKREKFLEEWPSEDLSATLESKLINDGNNSLTKAESIGNWREKAWNLVREEP